MNRPLIKDKSVLSYVEYLEGKIKKFEESPIVSTYLTILKQVDSFNNQLNLKESEKILEDGSKITVQSGFIDLFSDKDDKSFDRAWKYLNEAELLIEQLDKLRKKMTPEQQKEAAEQEKINNLGLAEKLALMSKK